MADRATGLHEAATLPLITGTQIFSADGQEMGLVKEIRDDFFKVDAPLKRDYWLSRDHVLSTSSERITVAFDKDELDRYSLADPSGTHDGEPPEGYVDNGARPDDVLEATGPGPIILGEQEQLEQRQRMEAELAEQRRRLPSNNEGTDGNG